MISLLKNSFEYGYRVAVEKYAIAGPTYARALSNAAGRSGAPMAPQLMSHISAQPRAQLLPGLSEAARTPGAIPATANQRGLQDMMHQVPFAGEENAGSSPHAQAMFNQQLQSHGRSFDAPGTNQAIRSRFGPPRPQGMPEAAPTVKMRKAAKFTP